MPPTGKCPVCGRQIRLRMDGTIREHGSKAPGVWPPESCRGWGKFPVTEKLGEK